MPATQSRVQQLTTTEAAVLALLAIEGERSGYDLRKLVRRAVVSSRSQSSVTRGRYGTIRVPAASASA